MMSRLGSCFGGVAEVRLPWHQQDARNLKPYITGGPS